MNEQTKSRAIAKLKNGETHEKIGEDLSISTALISEWADNLKPNEMIAKEINAIAIGKAQELLSTQQTVDSEQLKSTLLNLALAITDEVKIGLHDYEIAKAINISANTIVQLQKAFFSESQQIAVINNNNTNYTSSTELKTFKGALRK